MVRRLECCYPVPHLPSALLRACFPPPRDAWEDEGGGLRDLNDWNVWNESAEDIDRGEIPKFCSTKPLAGCGKTLSESFDRAQDERRGVDIIVVFRSC